MTQGEMNDAIEVLQKQVLLQDSKIQYLNSCLDLVTTAVKKIVEFHLHAEVFDESAQAYDKLMRLIEKYEEINNESTLK